MALLVFIVVLSILILVHESGHFFAARKVGVRVERFSLGFGPKLISLKRGETEYCICAIPFGGYVKMSGDERSEFKNLPYQYFSKGPFDRFKIVFSGALLNYVFAFVLLYFVFLLGYPIMATKVGKLMDNYPAKESGLMVGDKILSVDGNKVSDWEEMTQLIRNKQDGKVELLVLRGEQELNFAIKTKIMEMKNVFGQRERVGLVGIVPTGEVMTVKHGGFESFVLAARKQWQLTVVTYKSFWMMITGYMSIKETVSGPLGIFKITTEAASLGILALMHVMAVISLSLAIFNLLPVPVLDGGHIFFLALEGLRKKKLSEKLENALNQLGMVLLLALIVFVSFNDLQRYGVFEKIAKWFH